MKYLFFFCLIFSSSCPSNKKKEDNKIESNETKNKVEVKILSKTYEDVCFYKSSNVYKDFDFVKMNGKEKLDKKALLMFPFVEIYHNMDSISIISHFKEGLNYKISYKNKGNYYLNYYQILEENTEVYNLTKNGTFKEYAYIYKINLNKEKYIIRFIETIENDSIYITNWYSIDSIRNYIPKNVSFETDFSNLRKYIAVTYKIKIHKSNDTIIIKDMYENFTINRKEGGIEKYKISEPFSQFWHIYHLKRNPNIKQVE